MNSLIIYIMSTNIGLPQPRPLPFTEMCSDAIRFSQLMRRRRPGCGSILVPKRIFRVVERITAHCPTQRNERRTRLTRASAAW